jgi:hypothetical protein
LPQTPPSFERNGDLEEKERERGGGKKKEVSQEGGGPGPVWGGIIGPCIEPHPSTFSGVHLLNVSSKRGLRLAWQGTACSRFFISVG